MLLYALVPKGKKKGSYISREVSASAALLWAWTLHSCFMKDTSSLWYCGTQGCRPLHHFVKATCLCSQFKEMTEKCNLNADWTYILETFWSASLSPFLFGHLLINAKFYIFYTTFFHPETWVADSSHINGWCKADVPCIISFTEIIFRLIFQC